LGIFTQSVIIIGKKGKIGSYIVKLVVNMDLGSERRMRARFEE